MTPAFANVCTHADRSLIDAAIASASQKTSAKIEVVVLKASDSYRELALACGLVAGSLLALSLWLGDIITEFPWLLMAQLAVVTLFDIIPQLRLLCVRLAPHKLLLHRAKHMAFIEYGLRHSHHQHDAPYVMLFVSQAERYVHVVTNPIAHKAVPDNWNAVTDHFIAVMRNKDLTAACVGAVERIAEKMAKSFVFS